MYHHYIYSKFTSTYVNYKENNIMSKYELLLRENSTSMLPVAKLVFNEGQIQGIPANPRTITNESFDKLVTSLLEDPEYLNYNSLLVYPYNNEYVVLCGNMRLKALKHLKYEQVPCHILDTTTPVDRIKKWAIKDNVSLGDWDWAELSNHFEVADLDKFGVDIPSFMVKEESKKQLDELPSIQHLELTDLMNKITLGDCFEVLANIPDESIDCILIDPPYNNTDLAYDKLEFNHDTWMKHLFRVAKPNANILLFASGKFHYNLYNLAPEYHRYEIIWNKYPFVTNAVSSGYRVLNQHEYILLFAKEFNKKNIIYNHNKEKTGKLTLTTSQTNINNLPMKLQYEYNDNNKFPTTIWNVKPLRLCNFVPNVNIEDKEQRIHPSQKPEELIAKLIEVYSNPENIILDTCSGSGVVACMAKKLGRNFIALEQDKDFYNESIKRLETI